MNFLFRRATAAMLGAVCLVTLSGCKTTASNPSSGGAGSSTVGTTGATGAPTTAKPPFDLNPLTGEYDITPGASVRPIAVMVENSKVARPQYGLEKADMYVETETEGGITRIMAVFSGVSRIPDKLGPLRSARSPFIFLVQSLGAAYLHVGGSTMGDRYIQSLGLDDMNAITYRGGQATWRDETMRRERGYEHSLLTSGEKVAAWFDDSGFSSEAKKPSPFSFADAVSGPGPGKEVQATISGYQTVSFQYDEASGKYLKMNGKLDNAEPHKLMDGSQLSVTNVILMYDERFYETNVHIGFTLESGRGVLLTGGTSQTIGWKRTADALSFQKADGSALSVNPGKTYLVLLSKANESATVLR